MDQLSAVKPEELARMRAEVWRLRGRRSQSTGTALFFLGGVLFALAFLTRYIVFEISAIIGFLVGAILMLTPSESYVKMRLANTVAMSSFQALTQLLNVEPSSGNPSFAFDRETNKIRVSLVENSQSNAQNALDNRIPLSGEKLLEAIREELDGRNPIDYKELLDTLPNALVEGVGLAGKAEIRGEGDKVEVKLWNMAFRHFCANDQVRAFCGKVACPVNSSIASTLAMSSEGPILAEGCSFHARERLTVLRYKVPAGNVAETYSGSW